LQKASFSQKLPARQNDHCFGDAGISELKSSGRAGQATGPANSNLRLEPSGETRSQPDDALAGTLLRQSSPSGEGVFRMSTLLAS